MNVSSPLHACGLLCLSCVLSEKYLSAWSTSVRWRWVFWYTIWHSHFLIGFPRKNSDIEMVKWRAVGRAAGGCQKGIPLIVRINPPTVFKLKIDGKLLIVCWSIEHLSEICIVLGFWFLIIYEKNTSWLTD